MKTDQETRRAVDAVLQKMAEAIEQKDIKSYMKLFTKDPNMMTIGAEEEGMSLGDYKLKERMEKTFSGAETISFKYGYTSIKSNGPVAWVASHVYYKMKKKGKEETELFGRLTGVLEKIDEKWLWNQQHFSIPISIEAVDEEAVTEPEEEAVTEPETEVPEPEKTTADEPQEEPIDDSFYEIP